MNEHEIQINIISNKFLRALIIDPTKKVNDNIDIDKLQSLYYEHVVPVLEHIEKDFKYLTSNIIIKNNNESTIIEVIEMFKNILDKHVFLENIYDYRIICNDLNNDENTKKYKILIIDIEINIYYKKISEILNVEFIDNFYKRIRIPFDDKFETNFVGNSLQHFFDNIVKPISSMCQEIDDNLIDNIDIRNN